jgi:hypothetical protein
MPRKLVWGQASRPRAVEGLNVRRSLARTGRPPPRVRRGGHPLLRCACTGAEERSERTGAVIMHMHQMKGVLGDNTLRDLVIGKEDLNGALVIGITVLISFLLSIWGITTGLSGASVERSKMLGLKVFNWSLLFSVLVSTVRRPVPAAT